jgi:V8-like Glu-specific endopeptidase
VRIGTRTFAIVGGHDGPSAIATAVGQVGHCSATLVRPTVVLTSGHCLDVPVDHVVVNGNDVAVTECERHPAYQPGQVAHDVGYCRLATSVAGALPIDTAGDHPAGETVDLAGFGASSASAHEKPALRKVSTSIVRASEDYLEVGTATATACRGDSGGPVLVERSGSFGVAGVIEGAQGVICGSAARAVPLGPQMAWLRGPLASDSDRRAEHAALTFGIVVLASACVLAIRKWQRAVRRR